MESSSEPSKTPSLSKVCVIPLRKTPIFIINLRSAVARRESLSARLQYHGLEDQVTWVEAVGKDDDLISWYQGSYVYEKHPVNASEIGCFASHLKALKTYLKESKESQAIILEDDCVFHNEFRSLYASRMAEVPAGTSLVMLSHYVTKWEGLQRLQEGSFLFHINPNVLCTMGYWITREYATEVLRRYDKPFHDIELPPDGPRLTSEHITRFSDGLFLHPPLMVDEALESAIRPSHEMEWHKTYYQHYSFESYSAADRAANNTTLLKHWGLAT